MIDPMGQTPSELYWANEGDDVCAAAVWARLERYFGFLETSGRATLWRKLWDAYYVSRINQGDIERGEAGSTVRINHFRSYLQHIHGMVTHERPNPEPNARRTDIATAQAVPRAKAWLDWYMKEGHLEDRFRQSAELAILYSISWLFLDWDATAGRAVDRDPVTGEEAFEGRVTFLAASPFNAAIDPDVEDSERHSWICKREYRNRWDLMAQFATTGPQDPPEVASAKAELHDAIAVAPNKLAQRFRRDPREFQPGLLQGDLIPVWTFYHAKTPACPEGRFMMLAGPTCILASGPLPFSALPAGIPAIPLLAAMCDGDTLGYSVSHDLLPIQMAMDGTVSTVLTNLETFGVQNVIVPEGTQIDPSEEAEGLRVFRSTARDGAGIQAMQLTAVPADAYKFQDDLLNHFQLVSSVSDVNRGTPPGGVESGTALLFIRQQSTDFYSGLVAEYTKLVERVCGTLIAIEADHRQHSMTVPVNGRDGDRQDVDVGQDVLKLFDGVTIEAGNPLLRQAGGKLQIAENMMKAGLIKTPQHYLELVRTGNLDTVLDGPTNEVQAVRAENEALLRGEQVPVLWTDDPTLHLMGHKEEASSPLSRQSPSIVNLLNHMQEHVTVWRGTDPALLQAMGLPPPPPPPMPVGPMGPPPGPVGPAGPPAGRAPPSMPTAEQQDMAGAPKQPSMPKGA